MHLKLPGGGVYSKNANIGGYNKSQHERYKNHMQNVEGVPGDTLSTLVINIFIVVSTTYLLRLTIKDRCVMNKGRLHFCL